MKSVTVVIPAIEDIGELGGQAIISSITNVGAVVNATAAIGMPGPRGPQGERGPGIASNITRITAGTTPPDDPEVNDLWIDLT